MIESFYPSLIYFSNDFALLNLFTVHMNLKSHLPDGHLILTYIRPGKEEGRVLNLIKDLPWNFDSKEYLPLTRVQVFTSRDEAMSLSMFVYGGQASRPSKFEAEKVGARIIEYARCLQNGEFEMDQDVPSPSSLFEKEALIKYFQKCEETYIMRCSPRRFLKQRELYEKVSGTECMAISIEVCKVFISSNMAENPILTYFVFVS